MKERLLIDINGEEVEIEYSKNSEHHILGLPERPFRAIKLENKKKEYRTNTAYIEFDYSKIKKGHTVEFMNEDTGETLITKVDKVHHYNSAKELFEAEGLADSSSKPKTVKEAIKRLENLTGYKEGIKEHGVWAFHLELV